MQRGRKGNAKKRVPVVVIGAGLGGLCSAAYLARAGFPVTLVERHHVVGGYATSFRRGRFTFEVSLHGSALRGQAIQRIFADLGIGDQLELAPLPEFYRLLGGSLNLSVPQGDPDAYIDLLSHHFPHEAEGIRRFVDTMLAIIEETNRLWRGWAKVFKPLFPFRYPKMWRWQRATLAELIASCVSDPHLVKLLGALWSYYGLPPSKLSAFYYAVATGEYLKYGSFYVKPRSQQLSLLLRDSVVNAGGKVLTGLAATRIQLEEDQATAVDLSDGQRLPAQVVVSNISPQTMAAKLLPEQVRHKHRLWRYDRHRPSISAFIVWLGLKRPLPPGLQGGEYLVNAPPGPEAEYTAALAGDIQRGAFGITLYDNILPDYSPPGTATLTIIFLCAQAPWQRFAEDYRQGNKGAYNEEKQRWATTLIQRAEERLLPDLSAMIEVVETASPLTCERYTGNPQGAIYGYEQCVDNAFISRLPTRSPVKGLYLTGAWTFPGGGFGGVLRSGQATYRAIVEDMGIR